MGIILLTVWGSIITIKVTVAVLIASARKSRAKKALIKELRKGGLPKPLVRQIGDDYAPSTKEILTTIKRTGQPKDIAPAVLYLASDDSSYVTGAHIVIDGGWTCTL